jgi:hypothetical protein
VEEETVVAAPDNSEKLLLPRITAHAIVTPTVEEKVCRVGDEKEYINRKASVFCIM